MLAGFLLIVDYPMGNPFLWAFFTDRSCNRDIDAHGQIDVTDRDGHKNREKDVGQDQRDYLEKKKTKKKKVETKPNDRSGR